MSQIPRAGTPAETVAALFAAFNRHDAEGLAALYADDAVVESPDLERPLEGPAAIAAHYHAMFAQWPDVRDDVRNVVAAGDQAAVEFVSAGTMQMDGRPVRFALPICSVLKVRDGRIVRDASYFDRTQP